ncbi:uncharacterized protein LOC110760411, partial [Prunus avium]|uniref:Uncharacterized protein LOC110760411 n=1 Tax=Prunus avium TaxID=42229 RepID=A0A6P5SN93_PRUAV
MPHFYEGLFEADQNNVNAAAGGTIMTKTPTELRAIFDLVAANARQYNSRQRPVRKGESYDVSTLSSMEAQIANVTNMVKKLAPGSSKVCAFCSTIGHDTEDCPLAHEEANAVGSFQRNQWPKNDPFSQTYNPGWRNHPNFRWSDNSNVQQGPTQPSQGPTHPPQGQQHTRPPHGQMHYYNPPQPQSTGKSLEELVASMARNTDSFITETKSYMQRNDTHMQKTDKAIANLETQVGQIATALSQREPGMMPSQPVINPTGREHVQAVTLRTGKVIGEINGSKDLIHNVDDMQVEQVAGPKEKDESNKERDKQAASSSEWIPKHELARRARKEKVSREPTDEEILRAPFPHRLMSSKKIQQAKEILETFRKVQVNIPLLDAIKQIPSYAKFLKDLCTNKRRFQDHETVALTEEASAVLQRKLPPKLKDPGSFTIPCIIGDKLFDKALLDLGASINLMPYSVFEALNLGDLKPTSVSIQLADRSVRYPRGILEDVLVKVNDLILPADFLVLEMEEAPIPGADLPLILGRPFMATADTVINVRQGTLTMTVQGETIKFKVYDAFKLPNDEHECFHIDTLCHIVQNTFNSTHCTDSLEKVLTQNPQVVEIVDNELLEAVKFLDACPAIP